MEVPQHMTQPCLLRTMDGQDVPARLPGPLCISCSSVPLKASMGRGAFFPTTTSVLLIVIEAARLLQILRTHSLTAPLFYSGGTSCSPARGSSLKSVCRQQTVCAGQRSTEDGDPMPEPVG